MTANDQATTINLNPPKANISVIIPCYQCADTIDRAFESVINQTLPPKEVFLIDDFSSDNGKTVEAIHRIKSKYQNTIKIEIVKLSENSGAANARNIGWELATQPYIALLDADDAWHTRKIEIQYKFMQDHSDVDLCGHDKKLYSTDKSTNWTINEYEYSDISKYSLLVSNPFVTPSVMFKRNIKLRFNASKRYVDDHLLWLEIAFADCKVVSLKAPLVAIYKPMYGSSGLSSHMWKMEISELDNYRILYKSGKINLLLVTMLTMFSLLKYLRRMTIVHIRRIAVK